MKDRILNLLIVLFLTLILINIFGGENKASTVPQDSHLVVSKKTVAVPNYPQVSFVNTSETPIVLQTCENLTIAKNLQKLSLQEQFPAFCKKIDIQPKSTATIDFNPLSDLFVEPANIIIESNLQGKTSTQIVSVEERGFFRKLLAGIFYAPILNVFIGLLDVIPGHSLGLAIIAITIIVRLILLIPQHQMMVSARKMQEIQPKIKDLQDKHKGGDQAKLGMELMELYKAEKVNPLGSCLPLLIQTPILIVLYWVLISIEDHSNFFYFYSFFKDFNIAVIDTYFVGVNLLEMGGIVGLVLSLVVGLAQYVQIWLSQRGKPVAEKKEQDENSFLPDADLMNKTMLYVLPIMITISTYFFPYGVGLYWLIGTTFMIVQQQIANKIVDKEKLSGQIIIPEKTPSKKKNKTTVIEG